MPPNRPVVLLTGATGLVGGELLRRLAPTCHLVATTRTADHAERLRAAGARDVIVAPEPPAVWEFSPRLLNSVSEIIHCAADTRFGLPLDQSRLGNVEPTRRLLDLARRCRKLAKFAYLSTVYVAGRTTGEIVEAPNRHDSGFCNTYQQAKYEAEQLVFEAMSQLPAAVYRLSSIMGDSRTGRVRQFNYVHRLIRLLPRNVLPVAPVQPEAQVDLICTDWAADAVAYLVREAFVPGQVCHVCAGPDASVPSDELVRETANLLLAGGAAASIDRPRFVSVEEFESYVSSAQRRGDRLLNELLKVLGYTLPHLGICQRFDNTRCITRLAGSGIVLPPVRATYARVVDYCIKTDFGRSEPERVGTRVAGSAEEPTGETAR